MTDRIGMVLLVWFIGFCGQWCVLYWFVNNTPSQDCRTDKWPVRKACAGAGVLLVIFWMAFR